MKEILIEQLTKAVEIACKNGGNIVPRYDAETYKPTVGYNSTMGGDGGHIALFEE